MNQEIMFSIDKDTIEIDGMDALVQFTRYNPFEPELFLDGLELSEDLTTRFGTVMYAKGIQLTSEHIARLMKLQKSNPTLDFNFKINRSAKLIQNFRHEIKEQIFSLFNRNKKNTVYLDFLKQIDKYLEDFVDEILSDENIILLLYQMRFICKSSNKNKSALFMAHSINVALISLAIAASKSYEKLVNNSKSKLIDICKAGLFHNYGAITRIDSILDASPDNRLKLYWDANFDGYSSMDNFNLGSEIKDTFRFIYKYYMGKRDFINNNAWPSIMANIVLVAEIFLQKESGLFSEQQNVRKIIDNLNVRVAENELNERAVRALTVGLNLQDIFDFYKELDDLIKECPYNSAVPYPLIGFKSPTIFVCKDEVLKCKHIESSIIAVTLLHDIGKLKKGKYCRCWLLTPKLTSFYKKHYRTIKSTPHK